MSGLWDVQTGKELRRYSQASGANFVAYSLDSQYLLRLTVMALPAS